MSIWRFLFDRREPDQAEALIGDLHSLNMDWDKFRDRALLTLKLVSVAAECEEFEQRPSPETLVKTADSLLNSIPEVGREFFQLIYLVSVELAVSGTWNEVFRDMGGQPYVAYMTFRIALPIAISEILDCDHQCTSGVPWSRWVAAYLSALCGADTVLALDDACQRIVMRYGLEKLNLGSDFGAGCP